MPRTLIASLDDPRLDSYRDLKRGATPAGHLIAEGEKLVRRLLESSLATESILATAAALDRVQDVVPPHVELYVADTPLISRLIGFQFHRGILACGVRPARLGLEEFLLRQKEKDAASAERLLVLCPELRDPANLGAIIRTAAAFGASGVIAGDRGTDPYSRRVLRTSMGAVFRLPILQTDDWPGTLERLHSAGFETVATVLDDAAESLWGASFTGRVAVLLGNEDAGLPGALAQLCRRRVTVPMAGAIDSLNVAVAAGVVLSSVRRSEGTRIMSQATAGQSAAGP